MFDRLITAVAPGGRATTRYQTVVKPEDGPPLLTRHQRAELLGASAHSGSAAPSLIPIGTGRYDAKLNKRWPDAFEVEGIKSEHLGSRTQYDLLALKDVSPHVLDNLSNDSRAGLSSV